MDNPGWLMSAALEAAFAGEGGDRCLHGAAAPLASAAVSKIQRCGLSNLCFIATQEKAQIDTRMAQLENEAAIHLLVLNSTYLY